MAKTIYYMFKKEGMSLTKEELIDLVEAYYNKDFSKITTEIKEFLKQAEHDLDNIDEISNIF